MSMSFKTLQFLSARAPKNNAIWFVLTRFTAIRYFACAASLCQSQEKMPSTNQVLKYKKLTNSAFSPRKGSDRAAGFDLKSAYEQTIPARGKAIVMTDIQIQLPRGCYGRVAPRSGLAAKNGIDVGAGVIDEDYRGNIGVVLFNHSDNNFEINKGDRIAQLICEQIYYPEIQEVQELNSTERGAGGFGSTGVN